ncbi:MAG: glycogen debranching enzyme, partial [Chloroflexota bacterium]
MGDEAARTQYGNNNAYNHDNALSWLDWTLVKTNQDLHRFFKHLVAFRHVHHALRNRWHLTGSDRAGAGYPDVSFHGTHLWQPDFSTQGRRLAMLLSGKNAHAGAAPDEDIYLVMNMHWETHWFDLPQLPEGRRWHVFANTAVDSPHDTFWPGEEPLLDNPHGLLVGDRSVVILVGR